MIFAGAGLSTFVARPDAVLVASAGGAATSGGAANGRRRWSCLRGRIRRSGTRGGTGGRKGYNQ